MLRCVCNVTVVMVGWQVLVSSDGSKLEKLANVCVNWQSRVAHVLGEYLAHPCVADTNN